MPLPISVILCTHNPRQDHLQRTLGGLAAQTLPASEWELVLVDNASTVPVSPELPPSVRAVQLIEPEPGLTRARLAGMQAAQGRILVFVDDDNVLSPDYLEQVLSISGQLPMVGAWGAGRIEPEFEREPPEEFRIFFKYLALRHTEHARWTNVHSHLDCAPFGAGLCMRREVAAAYQEALRNSPLRAGLDRAGGRLMSCGDLDMGLTALDAGMGMGIFPSLSLLHLISSERVRLDYLLSLVEQTSMSEVLLEAVRGRRAQPPTMGDLVIRWIRHVFAPPFQRKLRTAEYRGREKGRKLLASHGR
jgi:glycosyltransferase involved in cell wall biosynthesis